MYNTYSKPSFNVWVMLFKIGTENQTMWNESWTKISKNTTFT